MHAISNILSIYSESMHDGAVKYGLWNEWDNSWFFVVSYQLFCVRRAVVIRTGIQIKGSQGSEKSEMVEN